MDDAIAASDVLRWAETLSAIARTGLGFTQSLYEQERFEEVLKVAADIRAAAVDVFYVHEAGEKVTDPARVERLRTALFDSLRRD